MDKKDDNKLTPEQIKNWRDVLCVMIGSYALIMPEEQIQKWRDKMQNNINKDRKNRGTSYT